MERLTPLKLPINEVFNTTRTSPGSDSRDQSNTILASRVRGILFLPRLQRAPNCSLLGPLKIPGGARPAVLTQRIHSHSEVTFRQPNTQPSREQRLIAQYKAIDWLSKFQIIGRTFFHSFFYILHFRIKYYFMLLIMVIHPSIVVHSSMAVHPTSVSHPVNALRCWDFPQSEATKQSPLMRFLLT